MRRSKQILAAIAFALVCGLAGAALFWVIDRESVPEPPRATELSPRLRRELDAAVAQYPGLAAHVGSLALAQDYPHLAQLAICGRTVLSDDELEEEARVRLVLLDQSDEVCLALTGRPDTRVALHALDSLGDDDLRSWAHLTARAAYLCSLGGPRVTVASEIERAIDEGYARVVANLSAADRARWDAVDWEHGSAEDQCAVERIVYRGALALPRAQRAPLLRALATRDDAS